MTWRKLVATTLVAALCIGLAPIGVLAADGTTKAPGIRASIDSAVAKNVTDHPQAVTAPKAVRRAAAAQAGGGGGGKAMAVVAILGTVGGLAATYFVVKQMRKQTNPAGR